MRWNKTRIRGVPQRNDRDHAELLLDELRREDDLFTSRFNLFLVAESLLFLSTATLMIAQKINHNAIAVIEILSIFVTSIYILITYRGKKYIEELHERLKGIYPNYLQFRDDRVGKGNVNFWFLVISILFLLAWIGLLLFNS